MNSKRILDALKQIPFQVMFLCLSGLIAIFVMIIPDYISKALMWFSEGMTANNRYRDWHSGFDGSYV